MIIAVAKETYPGERRVALVPASVAALKKLGGEVRVEAGAGAAAGFPDDAYRAAGAEIVADRRQLFEAADVVLQVRTLGANPVAGQRDLELVHDGLVIIGTADPLGNPQAVKELADRGVTLFAMELIPRITRAQSMDVLSSMATIAGYKAVLLAADRSAQDVPDDDDRRRHAHAGQGVRDRRGRGRAAGDRLGQAARRGRAGYDVRPAVKEQVESLGAKFVEMPLATGDAEGAGGYAKQLDEEFYRKQRELMAQTVAASDVCITTAAIPGKKSPVLMTADAVRGMAPGSVIVDLAAERGGNCELTRPDETVVENGVTILGPTNLPSEVPNHASQMYAKNLTNFVAPDLARRQAALESRGRGGPRDARRPSRRSRQSAAPRAAELAAARNAAAGQPAGGSLGDRTYGIATIATTSILIRI